MDTETVRKVCEKLNKQFDDTEIIAKREKQHVLDALREIADKKLSLFHQIANENDFSLAIGSRQIDNMIFSSIMGWKGSIDEIHPALVYTYYCVSGVTPRHVCPREGGTYADNVIYNIVEELIYPEEASNRQRELVKQVKEFALFAPKLDPRNESYFSYFCPELSILSGLRGSNTSLHSLLKLSKLIYHGAGSRGLDGSVRCSLFAVITCITSHLFESMKTGDLYVLHRCLNSGFLFLSNLFQDLFMVAFKERILSIPLEFELYVNWYFTAFGSNTSSVVLNYYGPTNVVENHLLSRGNDRESLSLLTACMIGSFAANIHERKAFLNIFKITQEVFKHRITSYDVLKIQGLMSETLENINSAGYTYTPRF